MQVDGVIWKMSQNVPGHDDTFVTLTHAKGDSLGDVITLYNAWIVIYTGGGSRALHGGAVKPSDFY